MSVESVGPIPSDLPAPLINPHEFQRFDVAATQTREAGDVRRRARFRSVAQRTRVQWLFTQDQFDTFWDWYESTLDAGAAAFDVNVAAQGVDGVRRSFESVWWVAQFANPYSAEAVNSGPARRVMYRISAELMLRGTPSTDRPAGTFRASGRVLHTGRATISAMSILATGETLHDGGLYGMIVNPSRGRVHDHSV